MLPVSFPGTNINFGPPATMTDEECDTIPGMRVIENDIPFCIFAIKPNLEDLNALNRDQFFYYHVLSFTVPPFFIYVNNKQLKYHCIDCRVVDNNYRALFSIYVDAECLKDINDGSFIMYKAAGETIFPFSFFTFDEHGKGNF